jgi:hypothetical protein
VRLADRQPPLSTARFVIVIDQHRRSVMVTGHAIERERGDLSGGERPADVHGQTATSPLNSYPRAATT